MADLNKIVDMISECSVVEVSELVKMLEEKFGVSAAAPVMVAAAQGGAEEAAKTEFNVVLKDVGASKMNIIKIVKDINTKRKNSNFPLCYLLGNNQRIYVAVKR